MTVSANPTLAAVTKMVAHLLQQETPSTMVNSDSCRYRGHNGNMCAVGCLIPDENYSQSLEGRNVIGLKDQLHDLLAPEFKGMDLYIAILFQNLHDFHRPEYLDSRVDSYRKTNKWLKRRLPEYDLTDFYKLGEKYFGAEKLQEILKQA